MQEFTSRLSISRISELTKIMNNWLTKDNYPVIKVARNYDTRNIYITQYYFNENGDELPGQWLIPITYTWQSGPEFLRTFPQYLMEPGTPMWLFSPDRYGWVIFNMQQVGMLNNINIFMILNLFYN